MAWHYRCWTFHVHLEEKGRTSIELKLLAAFSTMLGLLKGNCLAKACHTHHAAPLTLAPKPSAAPCLPHMTTRPRVLSTTVRAKPVNAATVEKTTETDLSAELKDVLSRVKPKVGWI